MPVLRSAAVVAAAGIALAACAGGGKTSATATPGSGGGTPDLKVTGAYMPQPVGDLAAGYFVVRNTGTGDDTLLSVSSPLSDDVSIHKTVNNRMVEAKSFDVPAGGSLDLSVGANHVMLVGVKPVPKKGQKVEFDLHFKRSGLMKITVPVKATNFQPPTTP
jgi:copper(I)-binding protein